MWAMPLPLMLTAIVLTGCAQSPVQSKHQPTVQQHNPLAGIIWQITAVNGKPIPAAERPPYMSFVNNTMSGFTGCNRVFGQVQIANIQESTANIQLQLASTKMACVQRQKQIMETAILQALNSTVRYTQDGKQLYFYDAKQQRHLTLTAAGTVVTE